MASIFHDFTIQATAAAVFEVMTTPRGIDRWWTKQSSGKPEIGEEYDLNFGPSYDWKAIVKKSVPGKEFEWTMKASDPDWEGTRIGFQLEENKGSVKVRFYHLGWSSENEHYKASSYCWAMYLRLVKRWLESGEECPFEARLTV
jgi:uncharacterized protein YndB with AHSA1/START domain